MSNTQWRGEKSVQGPAEEQLIICRSEADQTKREASGNRDSSLSCRMATIYCRVEDKMERRESSLRSWPGSISNVMINSNYLSSGFYHELFLR